MLEQYNLAKKNSKRSNIWAGWIMAFIDIPGFKGKVFIPDDISEIKKHDCSDCYICQMCSDERCEACLKSHCARKDRRAPDDTFCGY